MEKKIWLISDTHFNHDKDFIVAKRGYPSVAEMNEDIIRKWKAAISPEDEVYHLGDVFLGDDTEGMQILNSLPGRIHIIIGNHDNKNRISLFENAENVVSVKPIDWLEWEGSDVLLCHYPTPNNEQDELIRHSRKMPKYTLYGHTHQTVSFLEDFPAGLNVGVDAHHCAPILFDDAMKELIECRDILEQLALEEQEEER
ncbi:MAG: metallophosphoesterase family protein [Eubacterium sp.]